MTKKTSQLLHEKGLGDPRLYLPPHQATLFPVLQMIIPASSWTIVVIIDLIKQLLQIACLPTKHIWVHMNSFKPVRAFQIELEFGSVSFRGEGKAGVPGEKPLRVRERTNNKLNPHMASTLGVERGPHWWEVSALTTAPPLLPVVVMCLCNCKKWQKMGASLSGLVHWWVGCYSVINPLWQCWNCWLLKPAAMLESKQKNRKNIKLQM